MATSGGTPVTQDICRTRGDTFPEQFVLSDGSGVAIDITGFTFLLTVDPAPDPTDALANLFQITGSIVIPATNGTVEFAPSVMDSDQVPNTYFYDIQMTDAGGAVRTIVKGKWIVQQDVTK
jgi:hypothetical protein